MSSPMIVCDYCGESWTPTTNKPRFYCDEDCRKLADAHERLDEPNVLRVLNSEAAWDDLEVQLGQPLTSWVMKQTE